MFFTGDRAWPQEKQASSRGSQRVREGACVRATSHEDQIQKRHDDRKGGALGQDDRERIHQRSEDLLGPFFHNVLLVFQRQDSEERQEELLRRSLGFDGC